jgi:hypothetical protein
VGGGRRGTTRDPGAIMSEQAILPRPMGGPAVDGGQIGLGRSGTNHLLE